MDRRTDQSGATSQGGRGRREKCIAMGRGPIYGLCCCPSPVSMMTSSASNQATAGSKGGGIFQEKKSFFSSFISSVEASGLLRPRPLNRPIVVLNSTVGGAEASCPDSLPPFDLIECVWAGLEAGLGARAQGGGTIITIDKESPV